MLRWGSEHRADTCAEEVSMILTTTPSIEGKAIREYKGIVTGEAILGPPSWCDGPTGSPRFGT